MDKTGSVFCRMAFFCVIGVEPSGSTSTEVL
jgi:hypothetical protein